MTSATCSGCTACQAVCPRSAISFENDIEGFKIPRVDLSKCVDCGLCVKTCPAISPTDGAHKDIDLKTFAFQNKDENTRYKSASGALFPAFAKYFIDNLHGYVCGCILDDKLVARHIVSNKLSDIERMQDSKYVQSDMGNCMCEIIVLLKEGVYVLFTGTSCQCNGLKSLLSKKRVDESRLLTIDFFCHGVPSPLIWEEYLRFYKEEKRVIPIGYRFRCKQFGWGEKSRKTGHLNTLRYVRGYKFRNDLHLKKVREDNWSYIARLWKRIFFSNLCIRQYCHSCPYASSEKPADITMGDFWGVEKNYPDFSDGRGCSLVIIRNQKSLNWYSSLPDKDSQEVFIEHAMEKQANAFNPSLPHPNRMQFWDDYHKFGFKFVLGKYFNYNKIVCLKAFILHLLFRLHLRDNS